MTDKEKISKAAVDYQTGDDRIAYCHIPLDSFKAGVKWRNDNPSPEVLALVENFQNAYDYMCSSGYDKADPEEPEYQMLDCFRKALLEWDKK